MKQVVKGSDIIQVGGDLNITIHQSPAAAGASQNLLSREQRQRLSALVGEIESAEKAIISQRRIRYFLNQELGIKSVEEMTDDMYRKATMYLSGWKACALGEHQGEAAMVAQVIRVWTIVSTAQGSVVKFARDHFGTSKMNDLNYWQMRCTLAYAMHCWTTYWEERRE